MCEVKNHATDMPAKTLDQRIESRPGVLGAKRCVAGRRIAVEHIAVWHERLGLSADEIASEYDLELADVYAALAYYFAHREEIDQSSRVGHPLRPILGGVEMLYSFAYLLELMFRGPGEKSALYVLPSFRRQ